MVEYACTDCGKLVKKGKYKEYKNAEGNTTGFLCEECFTKRIQADIDKMNVGIDKANQEMEKLSKEFAKSMVEVKCLTNEGLHPKVMVPCGEVGSVTEFKNKPCPHCGSTKFEFNGDGFSCVQCGYFPEIEGG